MIDEGRDRLGHLRALNVQPRQLAHTGTLVGTHTTFLARIELGIDDQSVFQIVDAKRRRLPEANRTQMAGDA